MGLWLRRRRLCVLVVQKVAPDAPGDPGRSVLDRVPRQVRISRGRLHLGVTEQLPDHREDFAQGQRPRSIRMTKVVNTHVLQPGARADTAPGALEIGEMGARHLDVDDRGIVLLAGQGRQHGAGIGS